MIYYEVAEDNGDATISTNRFKTIEEAETYINYCRRHDILCSDAEWVNTDSPDFFNQLEDLMWLDE